MKRLVMAIALMVAIGLPQMAVAQAESSLTDLDQRYLNFFDRMIMRSDNPDVRALVGAASSHKIVSGRELCGFLERGESVADFRRASINTVRARGMDDRSMSAFLEAGSTAAVVGVHVYCPEYLSQLRAELNQ